MNERSGRKLQVPLVTAIVVVAVVAAGWWYQHSAELGISGGGAVSVNVATAGTAYSAGITGGKLPEVTVTSSRVILGDDSGPAATGAVVCEQGSVGSAAGPLSRFAAGCRDLSGADLSGLPDTAQIIVTVVPLDAQAVEVTGVAIEFRDGWRQGSQTLPVDFTVAAPT